MKYLARFMFLVIAQLEYNQAIKRKLPVGCWRWVSAIYETEYRLTRIPTEPKDPNKTSIIRGDWQMHDFMPNEEGGEPTLCGACGKPESHHV